MSFLKIHSPKERIPYSQPLELPAQSGNDLPSAAGKPPTRREVTIAISFAAVLLFFVVILSAVLSNPRAYDFAGYYTCGLIIHQGNASRLYDPAEQSRVEHQLLGRESLLINPHPPFEALFFSTLARLSYVKAYILWGVINVLLWALSQHLFWRDRPIPAHFFRYSLLSFLFFPLWGTLIIGQTTILLLFLFTLTHVSLARGHDFRAGVFLGLGLFKFPIVIPFALICFLRGKWRLMGGFTATALILGILSVIAVGIEGIRTYANLLVDILKNPYNSAYSSLANWGKMPTIKGLLVTVLGGRLSAQQIALLLVAVSMGVILYTGWQWRQLDQRQGQSESSLMFAAALTVAQITALHFYAYDLTLMLLAVFLVIASPQWLRKSPQRIVLAAVMLILYFPPVYALLLSRGVVYVLAPVLLAFALAAMDLARKTELTPI
jgi:hypothetical protein